MEDKKILLYLEKDIKTVANFINELTISGIANCQRIANVINILENHQKEDKKEKVET